MPITLRNAQELLDVLRNRDAGVTLALHRSLCREPKEALQLGCFEGRDVVDELLAQAEAEGDSSRGLLLTRTLSVFPADRVEDFFCRLFMRAERPEPLRVSAAWLASQPDDSHRGVLLTGLMQDDSPLRAREAARWLRFERSLTPPQAVRLALLDTRDRALPYPPVEGPFLPCWLVELEGPFQGDARTGLWSMGAAAFDTVQACEEHLSESNREWLLRFGTRVLAPRARDMVRRALASGSDRLVRAALDCVAEMGEDAEDLRDAVRPCLRHRDPAVREHAARVAPRSLDWRAHVATENDPRTRCVMVERWAQREGAAIADDLIGLLEAADWSMHAMVTDILVEVGDVIVDRMRHLVRHPDRGVQTAAQRVLMRLGHEAWLEAQMIEV